MAAKEIKKRITAKEAANAAAKYYQEVSNDYSGRLQVAEIELTEDGKFWNITLALPAPVDPLAIYGGTKLEYKIFRIDATTGEVVSMKVKKIE